MAKKKKDFRLFKTRQPVYKPFKATIMRLIFKKPEIINLAGEIENKSIIVVNHSNKSGPPCLDMYFPKKTAKWGAYQMFGNYKSRKGYLRDILYIQKCGCKPGFRTSLKASILGFLNPLVYKGMWMMPTYPDGRLKETIKNSCTVINADIPVMVFPENSNDGYKDVLTEFFPGFVMLAMAYYRQTGVDIPIYPTYYSIKKRILVIGKPLFVQDMVKEGLDRYQIAERYCNAVNELYFKYVENAPEK